MEVFQGQNDGIVSSHCAGFCARLQLHFCARLQLHQRGSLCQDPAGNRTTWRSPDNCKETQTAVVWSCLLFIRSGQKHLTRHSERGKKTRQTEEEVGRQHKGINGQAWSSASPRGQWRAGKNGGNRLWNHLWCPDDPCSQGIDEMMREYILSVMTVPLSPDDTG